MKSIMLALPLKSKKPIVRLVREFSHHVLFFYVLMASPILAQSPAGIDGDVQINQTGAFGADSGIFTYNKTTHTLNSINQSMSGFFTQSVGNQPIANTVDSFSTVPSDSFGNSSNAALKLTPRSWGVGKNVGNPLGFTTAAGWRVLLGLDVESFGGSSGIAQGIHVNPFHYGSGDSAAFYGGRGEGFSPCMWVDASGEGCVGININGTQFDCWASGTITSTTGPGDRNPVFNITPVNCDGAQQLINDGIIINTSVTVLHTALTGTVSSTWESNPFQIGNLPVTPGTAVLSTGIGVLTADIPLSSVPGQYQPQSFASGIHDGLSLTTGPVIIATAGGPEQCNILSVTPGPTSPQTGTISCSKFHPTGGYIFQGGTQGFGDFDDDMTQMGLHSVVYVLGATDTSHLIIAQRQAGAFSGLNLPYRGGEPAGLTVAGGFTVHPGALCTNTNSTNTLCTLEFNTVAWSTGHSFASPTGIPTVEELGSFHSTQRSPDSPQSPGTGLTVNFNNNTQHGAQHAFIRMSNLAPLSRYVASGVTGAWLSAPPAIDVNGPMGNLLQFDMMLPDSTFGAQVCNGPQAAVICYKNAPNLPPNLSLFTDAQGPEKVTLDGINALFHFVSWGITAPTAAFGSATVNGNAVCQSNGTNCPSGTGTVNPLTVTAEWAFNEGSGTTVHDATGNGHDGTFCASTAAPAWGAYGVQFLNWTTNGNVPQCVTTNVQNWTSISIAYEIGIPNLTTGTSGSPGNPYPFFPTLWVQPLRHQVLSSSAEALRLPGPRDRARSNRAVTAWQAQASSLKRKMASDSVTS